MTKEITLNESIELVQSKASAFQPDIIEELKAFYDVGCKVILYNGDTALPELHVGEDIIVVNGNLTVEGFIEDCKGVDSSLLIVLGDVKCKNLITLSAIFVTGNLIVDNAVVGDSYCDYVMKVGGDLHTKTIIEGGHWFHVNGVVKAEYIYNSHCEVKDKNGKVNPNLADSDIFYDFTENPKHYKGLSYVEMIDEIQKGYKYNLPQTIQFIKQGGERFYKS
jgi:hypothetical protein